GEPVGAEQEARLAPPGAPVEDAASPQGPRHLGGDPDVLADADGARDVRVLAARRHVGAPEPEDPRRRAVRGQALTSEQPRRRAVNRREVKAKAGPLGEGGAAWRGSAGPPGPTSASRAPWAPGRAAAGGGGPGTPPGRSRRGRCAGGGRGPS